MAHQKHVILWDWDNTLVDTFEAILSAQNDMRAAFGLAPWSIQEAKIAMNKSGRNLIADLVGEKHAQQAKKIYLEAYFQKATQISLKAGALEILSLTQSNGYINILASNKTGYILRNEVSALNLDKFFTKMVGAEDCAYDKPSLEFTRFALSGFPTEYIYAVGDGIADIQMAHHYPNGTGILIGTKPTQQEFGSTKPDMAFSSLKDAMIFFKQ